MKIQQKNTDYLDDLENKKIATITTYADYKGQPVRIIELNPGLPYDKRTKGCAHRYVCCVEIVIQNSKTTHREKALVFCGVTSKNTPDFSYVHRLCQNTGIGDLKAALKGYVIIDAVMQTTKDLAKQAKLKLTDKELQALKDTL
jgi:hypothetical protein